MYVGFFHTNQFSNSSDTGQVSCNSTQFWHQLLRVRVSIHFRCQLLGPQVIHTSVWLGYKVGVFSQIPFLRFDNLLECFIELSKVLYLLLLVSVNDTIQLRNIQIEEMHRARLGVVEHGAFLFFLGMLPSQYLNMFTNLEALWTLPFKDFYGGFII